MKIALTTTYQDIASHCTSKQVFNCVNFSYVNLITNNGALPILLEPVSVNVDIDVEETMQGIDGLILSGGEDIASELYNEKSKISYNDNVPAMGSAFFRPVKIRPKRERDIFEIKLYRYAKKQKIPILGICRGMHLINVAEGGTLHQEVSETTVDHCMGSDGWIPYHEIEINTSSQVFSWMKQKKYFVSSLHHQGIKKLGKDLVVAAKAQDGLVEIVESKFVGNYIVGVQSHIEQTIKNLPLLNTIFDNFFVQANKINKRG